MVYTGYNTNSCTGKFFKSELILQPEQIYLAMEHSILHCWTIQCSCNQLQCRKLQTEKKQLLKIRTTWLALLFLIYNLPLTVISSALVNWLIHFFRHKFRGWMKPDRCWWETVTTIRWVLFASFWSADLFIWASATSIASFNKDITAAPCSWPNWELQSEVDVAKRWNWSSLISTGYKSLKTPQK
jgi:hypothetical protein